ncbi:hypothetical protein [Sphingomonas sp. PB4P5]|uniref:hypothetical protein n=1 Tax=Parasphingomonas puruogangriensis TaxID=3096155 RepID=UPI002FC5ECDA
MTDSHPPAPPVDLDDYALTSAAVPSRKCHAGWSERRQRCFIAALRQVGSVQASTRAVGCSPQSAYKLRKRPDATEFAAAWDRALDEARLDAFDRAMARAVDGYHLPLFYRGRFTGTAHRHDHRAAIALLGK